jgi:hypothetical protein
MASLAARNPDFTFGQAIGQGMKTPVHWSSRASMRRSSSSVQPDEKERYPTLRLMLELAATHLQMSVIASVNVSKMDGAFGRLGALWQLTALRLS